MRVPAAYNGLLGLKPTGGRVSAGPEFDGVFNGLAVQVSVSRTVGDSAALPDRIRDRNGATPTSPRSHSGRTRRRSPPPGLAADGAVTLVGWVG
ncbi:amidase family protein [Streptomyces canus]|uniref:amidase family protein n=1 Tax=Streptomyces canus TaxID=58343 RepID=UPI001CED6EEF|nr:amidase family protein [Streptomyces canus]